MRLVPHLVAAGLLAGLGGCARAPEPDRYACREIPNDLVECDVVPRTPPAPG